MNGAVHPGLSVVELTTLIIFIATYLGLAVGHWFFLKLDRTGIALLGLIAMLALGCISLPQAVDAINADSILLLFALMVIASQLHYAGFYCRLAERVLHPLLDRPSLFLAVLIGLGGVLSAFLNNDVVVLALCPVIIAALSNRGINPLPFLIALALASNIGCALTTIGSAQNVMIGEIGGISFGGYMRFAIVPVVLSLAACYFVVRKLSRNDFTARPGQPPPPSAEEIPFNRWRTIKGTGVLIIIVSFFVFTDLPHYLVAMTGAGLLLCSRMLPSREVLNGVNWQLLVLFIALFVVTGAFVNQGLGDAMLGHLDAWGVDLDNPLQLAAITAFMSNAINNSATVMLLVKVVDLSSPLNCCALALANAFAGNLLIVGSLANIIAAQCAENFNLKIGFFNFLKYGAPTALISLLILFGWLLLCTAVTA